MKSWNDVRDGLAASCAPHGIDLAAATTVGSYDVRVPAAFQFGARPDALVVVLGNTRALWPPFRAALRADPASASRPDPLDRYVAAVVEGAVAALPASVVVTEVRLGSDLPPRRIAMQQLADAAGLAALMPSHLAVHATYGPWIGLRAAIVVDVDGPRDVAPAPRCAHCATACVPALARALATPDDWRAWLAARDACPLGNAHRYSEAQLRYHYTKDARLLGDDVS